MRRAYPLDGLSIQRKRDLEALLRWAIEWADKEMYDNLVYAITEYVSYITSEVCYIEDAKIIF